MQKMIAEYERCRERLLERIHLLDTQLREDETLGNEERDSLLLRRSLLLAERTELLHAIREMREHHAADERGACAC